MHLSVCLSILKEENSISDEPIVHSHSQRFPSDIENGGWAVLVPRLLKKSLKIHWPLAETLCIFKDFLNNLGTNTVQPPSSVSIYLSVCSVCLSVCLSVYRSVCLSVCLSIYRSVCLSVCLSIGRSVCLSVCLSVSVCLSIGLSVSLHLSVVCGMLYYVCCI